MQGVSASGRSANRARSRSAAVLGIGRSGLAEEALVDGCEGCARNDNRRRERIPHPASVGLTNESEPSVKKLQFGLVTIGKGKAPPAKLSWFDYLQSSNLRKVPFVECGHLVSPFEGGRRD